MCLSFPDLLSHPDSIPVFFSDHVSLLSLPVHVLHFSFPADIRVIEIPHQNKSLQAQCLLHLKQEGLINRIPLRQPVIDSHQMSFIGNFLLQVLKIFVAVSQRLPFTIYTFINIHPHSESPDPLISSKMLVAHNHSTPIV